MKHFRCFSILNALIKHRQLKKKVMKIICINFEWISSNKNNKSNRDESLSEEQIKREDNDDMSRQIWWENQKSVCTQLQRTLPPPPQRQQQQQNVKKNGKQRITKKIKSFINLSLTSKRQQQQTESAYSQKHWQ